MSGKCRPSLRPKTLENVKYSNLSKTDKECIAAVFERFENMVEVVRCKDCKHYCLSYSAKPNEARWCELSIEQNEYPKPNDFCSYGEREDGADNE